MISSPLATTIAAWSKIDLNLVNNPEIEIIYGLTAKRNLQSQSLLGTLPIMDAQI